METEKDVIELTLKITSTFFTPEEVIEMITEKLDSFSSVEQDVIHWEIVSKIIK